jgi:ribosome-binding protein aMBF1 (putative translation factor)
MTEEAKHMEGRELGIRTGSADARSAKGARKASRPSLRIVPNEVTQKQRRLRVRDKADLAHLIDKLVAKRIRTYRLDRGLTQQSLAEEVGVASQQIHKYESGISRISAGRLLQIAEALDLSVHEFFDFQKVAGRHNGRVVQK